VKLLRRRAETRTEFLGRTDRARQSASAGTLEADDLILVEQGVGVASGSPMAIRVRYPLGRNYLSLVREARSVPRRLTERSSWTASPLTTFPRPSERPAASSAFA